MSGAPYIVWSPDGPTPPKVSHETHKKALWQAHEMAKKHPGQQFYVMARAGKGAKVHADFCTKHTDQLAVANMDGEFQCQLCADTWVRGEGQTAQDAEAA